MLRAFVRADLIKARPYRMFGVAQRDGHGRPSEDRIVARELGPECRMFAVFDGHAGSATSEILMNELPDRIREAIEGSSADWPLAAEEILQDVFIRMDQNLAGPPQRTKGSGAVAVVALVVPGEVIVAWVGDSPGLLVDMATRQVLRTTRLHHPTEPDEAARIKAAGGEVIKDEAGTPRVDGGLMISRAFGDFMYKWNTRSQRAPPETADWGAFKVTALPEVARWPIVKDSVLILSSDGLLEGAPPAFDALPPGSIGERVMRNMAEGRSLNVVAKQVLEAHIAAATGGGKAYMGDDLSLLIVPLSTEGPLSGGGKKRMRAYKTRRAGRVVRRRVVAKN
jgi:serine/threonine protein phosphatase PrpC